MPRLRRLFRRRREPLTRDAIAAALFGPHFGGSLRFLERERVPLDWNEWGGPLLRAHVAYLPGTRPYAWWRLDAPERVRRHVAGPGSWCVAFHEARPEHRFTGAGDEQPLVSFGLPRGIGGWDFDEPTLYEGEAEYLARLGLLAAGEEPCERARRAVVAGGRHGAPRVCANVEEAARCSGVPAPAGWRPVTAEEAAAALTHGEACRHVATLAEAEEALLDDVARALGAE